MFEAEGNLMAMFFFFVPPETFLPCDGDSVVDLILPIVLLLLPMVPCPCKIWELSLVAAADDEAVGTGIAEGV